MDEVSFDQLARHYDAPRPVPTAVFCQLLERLQRGGLFRRNDTLVDVGCGTGLYLRPFSSHFVRSIGLDVSEEMLKVAREKCGNEDGIEFVLCDAREMSLPSAIADVVISSKLFIHVREWREIVAEICRISKHGAYFIYMNETGLFNNDVRRKFRELCDDGEMKYGFLGEVNLETVAAEIERFGYDRVPFEWNDLEWLHHVRYDDAFQAIRNRAFAEFQAITDHDYAKLLRSLAEWIADRRDGWNASQEMTAKLRVDAFEKKKG